ncbi:hypothetical protein HMI55_000596 [Coelomomyces lativittatus]|nr:hypothetical protein HMI56_005391 [Coelomomyces lativittatus]KAJ1507895.1 hypothetical protein HMI55_000596 [Coelomomyces lativittatus]
MSSSSLSEVSSSTSFSSIHLDSPMQEALPFRRNSKVQFKDDVQVAFTFPCDEYDRNPIEPRALTSRDYLEYQIMNFEMNQSNKFEVTMRQLGLWSFFCATDSMSPSSSTELMASTTTTPTSSSSSSSPFSDSMFEPVMSPISLSSLNEFVGWTPRSHADPITKELLLCLHSRSTSFNLNANDSK